MRTRTTLLLALLMLIVAACGGGEDETTTTTNPATTTTTTVATTTTAAPTTSSPPPTTTIAAPTTTTQPIDVYYEGGQVVGPGTISVTVGDQVSVVVLSDTDDEIHVHGYDLFFAAKAGVPTEVALTAEVPGIFEVELESSHTLLFRLEVTP